MPEQVVGRQRLFAADVDHRAGQLVVLQCRHQVGVHHRDTTPGIDKQRRGLEPGEQRTVVDVVGIGGVGQQVDQVVGRLHQATEVVERPHAVERHQRTRILRHPGQVHAEAGQGMRHRLADLPGAHDHHLPATQPARRAAIPLRTDLAGQATEELALVGEHVGQQVFAHHLAEDAYRACQAVVLRQVGGQQRRDARPGRLHPDRMHALAQHLRHQVGLAEPDRALAGGVDELQGIVPRHHLQAGVGRHQQRGIESVVTFENQQAHGSHCQAGQGLAIRPENIVLSCITAPGGKPSREQVWRW